MAKTGFGHRQRSFHHTIAEELNLAASLERRTNARFLSVVGNYQEDRRVGCAADSDD